jgi:hypothetical protein
MDAAQTAALVAQVQQLTQQVEHLTAQQHHQQQQPNPAPQQPLFRPPKKNTFSGDKGTQATLPPWTVAMETYLRAHPNNNLQSTGAVEMAAAFLKGPALMWFQAQRMARNNTTPFATWQEFKDALTKWCLPMDLATAAWSQLKALRQTGSAQIYVNNFNTLLLDLPNMDTGSRVRQFMDGLKPDVQVHVAMQAPTELSAAQELAVRVDTVQFTSARQRQRAYHALHPPSEPTPAGPAPMELGAHSAQNTSQPRKCFECGSTTHISYDCPQRSQGGRGRGRGFGRGRGRGRGRSNSSNRGAPN